MHRSGITRIYGQIGLYYEFVTADRRRVAAARVLISRAANRAAAGASVVSPARARCTVRLQMSLGSLVVGIDVGGTNTDAALVFTPAPRTADNPEVVELLESWVAALAACGRGEEAEEMDRQLRRRRAMMQWQDHTGEWRHANLRGIVCGWVKRSTTADITSGVAAAILAVTGTVWAPSEVSAVLIGTTHFVNAIVQRSAELAPVAVLRLCGPATRALPPFVSLPADLAAIVRGHYCLASGGLELDGQREIA